MADADNTVTEMALTYAEQAVATGRQYQAHLDYSERSLRDVEAIMRKLAQESSSADLTETCKMWGSYLGEVVRRRFGGDWSIETYPGKQFATLTLNVAGSRLFPTMKIHRRLTQDSDENIWSFYEMVKARLEAAPGGRVQ